MILSDQSILKLMEEKELVIEPLVENAVQPASIDCSIGTHFLSVDEHHMDIIRLDEEIKYRAIEADEITLPPHSFILATTQQYFELPDNLTAFVEGRSSIGRMGLFIQNAGWVDPGFKGRITLELYNSNSLPIKLKAGWRICQLVFCTMSTSPSKPYRGKYQGQMEATGSRVFLDGKNL